MGLVRKKLQKLIPLKWFGVVGYYQDNWLIPYIYIYGISEKDQENYYRVYKDMPDLALPFLIKHGLPSRAREILEMYMGVCNKETLSLFESNRVVKEIHKPGGVY